MLGVRAQHADDPFALDDLALVADLLHTCSDFHVRFARLFRLVLGAPNVGARLIGAKADRRKKGLYLRPESQGYLARRFFAAF